MTLNILLYIIVGILTIYIIASIAVTRKFSTGDAIALLGIVISIIVSLSLIPSNNEPQNLNNSTTTFLPENTSSAPTQIQTPVARLTSTATASSFYNDFNNLTFDGTYDKSQWYVDEDYEGACITTQNDGYLIINHTPSSSLSGCYMGGYFNGVGGDSFQFFESKIRISNNFQGTCCGYFAMTLSSNSFSGGGGWIECGLHPQPGYIAGVFSINHSNSENEFFRKLETTFNSWHTINSTGEYHLDDVKTIP
jgi:hypothetical protein